MLSDEKQAAAFAREAADIYHRRLGAPERALPALERALALMPDERSVRAMMAGSLRAAGETGRARTLLEKIIADFGRRRSKERAALHGELALVARAEGKLDEALSELEQASQMDVGNTQILQAPGRGGARGAASWSRPSARCARSCWWCAASRPATSWTRSACPRCCSSCTRIAEAARRRGEGVRAARVRARGGAPVGRRGRPGCAAR